MKAPTRFGIRYLLALLITGMFIATIAGARESWERVADRQPKERVAFIENLSKDYKRLDELWKLANDRPAGVTPAVMKGIQMSVIYPGQKLEEIEAIFGKEYIEHFESGEKRLKLVPLECHNDQIKLPHTSIDQWHLVLRLDKNRLIEFVSVEFLSGNKLILHGFRYQDHAAWLSDLPRSLEAEQPGAAQPATQPADKPPAKDQPSTPTSKDAPR